MSMSMYPYVDIYISRYIDTCTYMYVHTYILYIHTSALTISLHNHLPAHWGDYWRPATGGGIISGIQVDTDTDTPYRVQNLTGVYALCAH